MTVESVEIDAIRHVKVRQSSATLSYLCAIIPSYVTTSTPFFVAMSPPS